MKYFLILIVMLTGFSVILIENAFAEEEMLVFVENDVRKLYYTGENITSAFFDKEGAVIFATGNNAKLTVKAPQVYTYGGQLFVLRNGEEVIPEIETDDCFYYVTFQTQFPEKIELLFAHWPEATEVRENCETFKVSPLKQMKLGIHTSNIVCKEDFEFITKYNGSPACVKPETKTKLIERGWGKPLSNISEIPLPKISQKDAIKIIENDLKNHVSNTTKILKIVDVIGDQDKYIPFSEFQTNNKIVPLVFVSNNDTLLTINNASLRINYLCNMGTIAYCGYMPPFNLDYKSHLVYGFDIVYGNNDSNMEPSFYAVDAVSGDIVDSGFLRNEAREK